MACPPKGVQWVLGYEALIFKPTEEGLNRMCVGINDCITEILLFSVLGPARPGEFEGRPKTGESPQP